MFRLHSALYKFEKDHFIGENEEDWDRIREDAEKIVSEFGNNEQVILKLRYAMDEIEHRSKAYFEGRFDLKGVEKV